MKKISGKIFRVAHCQSQESLALAPFCFCKNQASCKHWDSKINKPQRKACKGNARQLIGESSDKNYGVRTAYSRLGKCQRRCESNEKIICRDGNDCLPPFEFYPKEIQHGIKLNAKNSVPHQRK